MGLGGTFTHFEFPAVSAPAGLPTLARECRTKVGEERFIDGANFSECCLVDKIVPDFFLVAKDNELASLASPISGDGG